MLSSGSALSSGPSGGIGSSAFRVLVSPPAAPHTRRRPRMTQTPEPGSLEGQTLGKKYLVRKLLGAGGMGAVYAAEHLLTRRVGALKLLHASYANVTSVVARFQREASAAGRIGNVHIVETLDAGELMNGQPYLFMELLRGRALREVIATRGRLPLEEAVNIVLQAADGLSAAHAAGIVHRDVKPDNLFICEGSELFVKILDFGISKFAERAGVSWMTEQGAVVGTPHYMAPEQVVSKRDIDERVDVYALGVVLYECLSGKVPFDAPSLPALSVKIFEGRYTPAGQLAAGLPAAIDAFIGRAIARNPSERFASMSEFRQVLRGLLPGPAERSTTVLLPASDPTQGAAIPERKRHGGWLVLGLVVAAAGVAAATARFTPQVAPPRARPGESASSAAFTTRAPAVPQQLVAEPSTLIPTPSAPGAGAASPPPAPAPPATARATTAPQPKPRSSAAADGLVERNPFAD
jgi:eukaryotic-like serine/threonine-protein kinase